MSNSSVNKYCGTTGFLCMCVNLVVMEGWEFFGAFSEGWCLLSCSTEGCQILEKWHSIEVKFVL